MCGIFGVYGHPEAARLTYLGIYSLQHRGEEGAGIVSFDAKRARCHKGMGLVGDIFNEAAIKSLKGQIAIGHNRYSTTGSSSLVNVQPFLFNHKNTPIAISHNGNFTNTAQLRSMLEKDGAIFQTSTDSEILAHLLTRSKEADYKQALIWSLQNIKGTYSLVLLIGDLLVAARDPYGNRPLCLGELAGAYVLASETCALDLIQARFIRDIEPGEVVFISKSGLEAVKPFAPAMPACCIFEYIYFSRPDSNIFGYNVYQARKKLGEQLAREHPVSADLVMPVPDSGTLAALGFAQASGIAFEQGLVRNHYIGRTFIQPTQYLRDFRVKVKLNPVGGVLKDKRIAVIEDSIVRGTTSRARVKTLRQAGAKEIHMRISCPPLRFPCYYGVDFPTKKELVASKHSVDWIREFIGLDSLEYISLQGMLDSMPLAGENFCTACFSGKYPIKPPASLRRSKT